TITELTDSVDGGFPSDITELSDTITATNCDDVLGSTLPVGGSSTCSFTAIVSGPGNTTVTDVVTARAEDADGNEATAQDDAAVNIVGVLPEIAVTKTPSVNSIMEPGGPVTYTVAVTNTGVEPVTLDTFTDTMESDPPVDITVVDGPITATDCNTLVGVTIDVDETVSCTYTYMHHGHVNQFEDGYINDTVTVTGHDDDGTVTATADAKVALLDAPPVITVTKSANPTSVPETAPGQTREITFTVNVTNLSVEDVTITSLVDSVEGGPAVPIGGTCAALIGTVLVPEQTVSCTFTGLVAGDFGDVVHDTVTATAVDDEQNTAKDSDDAEVSFTDVASSIEVTKTANPTVMNENGGPVTYSVVIRNTSPIDRLKIATITDQIGDNPPFALNGECGALVGFELAPGEQIGCSFTLPVTGNAGTVVTDIVKVTATDDDGGRVSDDDDATVTIVDLPSKLTVTKTAEVDTVDEPGGPVTYRVMISNDSEVDLITIDSIVDSVDGAPAQPVTSPSCVALLGTILAPGDSTSCTFEMTVTGNAGDEVHDVVTVYGTDDDGNPVSDEDPEVVDIVDVAPTGTVTKTASPSTLPETGGTVTFTVIATNTSPDESVTVTALTDEIGGVTYDITSPNGPITATTCVLGTVLAPAESYSCEFDVAIPAGNAGDVVSDIVRVTLTDDEGNPVTPSDPEEVILTDVAPSIEVTKDNTPDTLPAPGGPVKFEVTVTNTSEEAVTLTSLTDSVEGAPPVDITTVAGSISATTCELGIEIVAGDSYSCSFTMLVSSDEPAEITDVVSASAIDDDGTSVTDTDDALTTITGSADLSIDKELLSKGLEPGKQGSYRLTVTNNGPSTALNPVVVDTLPKGVTPLEASAEGWDCSVAGQITTCERASLASGQSSVITLSVQVDESAAGQTITNVAKVGSDTEDPDPNNNRDEETTEVPQAPPSDNTEDREHPSEEDQGILPVTGSDVLPIVAAGLVLVAMGGGFIGLRRRVRPINQ
ncbi:MAG: DUF11 domain-containing protein, partial [Acidimicrobiales bacterium]|nr:DUF11 domain-containing protein [Acidimicrobiales bacterium]